jgi:photosystem II stability/assembly factor-like uncharacterized protein
MKGEKKLFILVALLSNLIFSQELIWKHTDGPMGGIVGGMDINSDGDIYTGVYPFLINYTGLYKSVDNGDSWKKIETQFEDFNVFSVYITQEDHIWVGTDHQGALYRSTDNGQTWENKNNGYGANECWAIGESKDGVLFAGDANAGITYHSTDKGDNWEFSAIIAPLAFAADSNNIVYSGTFTGLYSTTDNGKTWVQDSFLSGYVISSILADTTSQIYCGTGYYNNGDGVFYSTNGGQNWTQLGLEGKTVLSLAFDSDGSLFAGTLYDGLFKTSDLGQNWYQYQKGIYRKQVYRLKINQQDDIFIGSEGGGEGWQFYGSGGVFRSMDGGASFEQVGLPISRVKNIVFSGDSLIVSSTPSGVQKYNRLTKKWKNLGLHNVEAVTITPSNILYAATIEEGLYKSTDIGEHWTLTNLTADTLMPVYNVLAINNDTLFAATGFGLNLRRSTNGGQNWEILPLRTGDNSRGLFFNSNNLWVTGISSGSHVFYKSSNIGISFDSLYSGFNTWSSNNPISATNNGYVFLASRSNDLDGIIRSTDDGLHWEQVLSINNTAPTVFNNDDGVVITGSVVFSLSDTNKIYLSTDYGYSWSSMVQPTGFSISITDVKQDIMNKFFFATSAAGLYEVDIITNIEEEPVSIYNYSLFQNYPNPFNPITHIRYSIPQSSRVILKVYDVLGNQVAKLVDKYQNAGEYDVIFSADELASGIYFYRLMAGSYNNTKKMIFLK